jgi:sugar lactone lactonase YvrE
MLTRLAVVVSMLVVGVLPGASAAGALRERGSTATGSAKPPGGACAPWHVRTLISGQGWLENLEFDGRGAITISGLTQGRILRLSTRGRLTSLLAPVFAPGGERKRDRYLYFNTGDTLPVTSTGTIDRLDLRTGRHSTWAHGLTMPNGLVFLPNGDAVVSRDVGSGTGLTRVPARAPRHPQIEWARLDDTNGLAVDPSGRWLYTDRTFSSDGEVDRVLIASPRQVQVVGRLGAGVAPDDMTVDKHGVLYVVGFGSGKIYRLDPRTHSSCAIAAGLEQPTSARFGGHGWHAQDLYVTDAGGHLSELGPVR